MLRPLEPAATIPFDEVERLRTIAFDRGDARTWREYTAKRAIYRDYTLRRFSEVETADSDESDYR